MPLVATFDDLPADAAPIAGGKGASLGRMTRAGLPVPPGFVVCAGAFREFLAQRAGADRLLAIGRELDVEDPTALQRASDEMRGFILAGRLPESIDGVVREAYRAFGDDAPVAVRSSAVGEDGDAASFAGQQETYLNVRGAEQVARRVQECWASFFSPRALFYRARKGALTDTGMAVVVQEMVQPEKSGVMFTADPVHRRLDHLVVEAVRGLGEAVVSGEATPDHYVVDRGDGSLVREFLPDPSSRVLDGGELARLRALGARLEEFFGKPQDVEWCIRDDELLLLQSRPITTL
jgi:pyruvate,water dikinase